MILFVEPLGTRSQSCNMIDTPSRERLDLLCMSSLVILSLNQRWRLPFILSPVQLWPFYCHEQTAGPYSRFDDHKDAVKCRSPHGAEKVVRLFPGVVDILSCLNQQVRLPTASQVDDAFRKK